MGNPHIDSVERNGAGIFRVFMFNGLNKNN